MCQREICNLLLDYMWGSESLKVFPRWIVTAVLNVVSPLPFTLESSFSGEMKKIVNMFKIHLSCAFLPQPP